MKNQLSSQWRNNANLMVVWADGTYDASRVCSECCSPACSMPIHEDLYKTLGHAVIDEASEVEEAAGGYWGWMHSNSPLGSKRDHDGDLVTPELVFANPDSLPEGEQRSSGVSELQNDWMQEAYDQLTAAQKEVWDAIMREQIPQIKLAERLGITKQSVRDRLNSAKLSVTNYLRSKNEVAE